MGLADAVPGVSGGTVALLLGIHPRLVAAIAALHPRLAVQLWMARKPSDRPAFWVAWKQADIGFLILLGMGLVVGLLVGAKVLVHALDAEPRIMAGLFLGLIIASIPAPWQQTEGRARWGIAFVAAAAAFAITVLPATPIVATGWRLVALGAIAACAMILPGISGAYLLLLFGAYEPVLHAVAALDVAVIVLVAGGAVAGLLAFGRGLNWLLQRHRSATHAAMVGLLIGSIGRLWPWRSEAGFAAGAPAAPVLGGAIWIVAAFLVGAWLGRRLLSFAETSSADGAKSSS